MNRDDELTTGDVVTADDGRRYRVADVYPDGYRLVHAPPHEHDAWDALAAAPWAARDYHDGQWSALYALGSSGAYVLPDVLPALEDAADIADGLDPAEYEQHDGELAAQAEDMRTAAAVLSYLWDTLPGDADLSDEAGELVAARLRDEYGIAGAHADGSAVYVPAP